LKATAKDLRTRIKLLLDAVDRGEEVTITYRGKPRARLVPVNKSRSGTAAARDLFGLWKDRTDLEDVDGYVDQLRRRRF
jgi:prevent-host-death family protein